MTPSQIAQSFIPKINSLLVRWYENAKIDYNVDGSAVASIELNDLVINYTENGVEKVWRMCYLYDLTSGAEYYYDMWCIEA